MKRIHSLLISAATLAIVPSVLIAAESVEEVVAKHIEARGGAEAWKAVDSIELTGDFTAFSKIKPFKLVKKRDRLYFMDHHLGDKPVQIGYDGETIWWNNRWFQDGAQEVSEAADLAVIERELDFVTPLFDIEARGHKVEVLDQTDLEGEAVIALKLTRSDESEETWYLHPETYLEFARDSPASDFGRAMTQRTYFDDFREVSGVKIPFFTETQWYTRHRVMEVAEAKVNVKLDDGLFNMPVPPGMEGLLALAGDWQVEAESRQSPDAPWTESSRETSIKERLGGVMVTETYETEGGAMVHRSISYDRHRQHWVLTSIDAQSGLMDIQTGTQDDQGVLTLSNMETGTSREVFGFTVHERSVIHPMEEGGFKMERHNSIDGGENWFQSEKLNYQPRASEDS